MVVAHAGSDLGEEEIKRFVQANLAGYKVPRDVGFVAELPRTSTGKALPAGAQAGVRYQ